MRSGALLSRLPMGGGAWLLGAPPLVPAGF
jgi:hypothetical protein